MNERVRMVREICGLSRAAFGEELGVSGDVINNLERGRVDVKDSMVKLICSVYSVDEYWLRTGEGEMFVKRTRNEEIADFVADIFTGESGSFKQRLIAMLARLDEKDWEYLEEKAIELANGKDNKKD